MPERAVFQAIDRQAGALVGVFRRQALVDVDAMPRRFARCKVAILEAIGVWKHFVDTFVVGMCS